MVNDVERISSNKKPRIESEVASRCDTIAASTLGKMFFLPFARMLQRVETEKQDSDTSYFFALMYFGELVTKFTVAGLVAAVLNDKDRHRYTQLHRLVRADGIGEWANVLDDVLTGPASQFLQRQARAEQKELTQRIKPTAWQYEAVSELNICLRLFDDSREDLPAKVDGRKWFTSFAELRNKSRGHGAPSAGLCSRLAPRLANAINLLTENHVLFRRPWVVLHRNLSGKYRITKLTDNAAEFESLKSDRSTNLPNGVYAYFDRPTLIELVNSDADASDFFLPNGAFSGKHFEVISYISGSTMQSEAAPYLLPATELPASETEGLGSLDAQGKSFGNLPLVPGGYIKRPKLEQELKEKLLDERHPVITLAGRGGIGKTSTALASLHSIAEEGRFGALLWFSARDIDLLQQGPKVVRPHVLTESDIAKELVRLMSPAEAFNEEFDPEKYFAAALSKSPIGDPIVFTVDNFETVRNPDELFAWLNSFIRLPNKLLITTRFRDFKGDYPVDVLGMTDAEARELVNSVGHELRIRKLLPGAYIEEVVRESDGHPYVIKILLGEVAKAGALVAIKRVIATKDEILPALFERTYAGLSPAARRVFLLLASWRSVVPELAVQAVLTRPGTEAMDIVDVIEELRKSSMIDIVVSKDKSRFISVPLVASEFGKRKLAVSSYKSAVEADLELLQLFGPGQKTDLIHGVGPRITRLFRHVEGENKRDPEQLQRYLPMLEFVAQQYVTAWLLIASLWEQSSFLDKFERAKDALSRYLERVGGEESRFAWERLADLSARTNDWIGELHARVALCELPNTSFETISDTANRLNGLYAREQFLDSDERRILVGRLAHLMDARRQDADATDLSRLAWLYLQLHDEEHAIEVAKEGLELDPFDEHCQKLKLRLGL